MPIDMSISSLNLIQSLSGSSEIYYFLLFAILKIRDSD